MQTLGVIAAHSATLFASHSAWANNENDVLTTATALDSTSSYGSGTLPTTTDDLTFSNATYGSTTFTLNTTALSIGTLDDLDATQALTINGSQSITLNGGTDAVAGSAAGDLLYVATGANLTVAGTGGVILAASGNFDVAGTAQINSVVSGGFSLTKTGAGTLTLAGTNTYSGGTTVSAGTLQLGDGTAGHDGSVAGNITDNASLVFNLSGSQTYGSVISGTGALNKTGAGTLILTNGETFSGGTTVNGGILQLNRGGGNGTLSGVLTINAGGTVNANANDALGYNGGTGTVSTVNVTGGTFNNAAGGNNAYVTAFVLTGGSVTSTGGGAINFEASSTVTLSSLASSTTSIFSAPITLRDSTLLPITVAAGTTASGIDLSISGAIGQNGGGYGIDKEGPGLLQLSGANTYTGATMIGGGTLQVGVASVTGTSGALGNGSNVTLANTAGAVLDLNGFNTTIGSLIGGGTTGGSVTLGAATLTVGQGNNGGTFAGVISGTGAVVKTGTGTEELDGASLYSGGTTISGGTLQTNNSNYAAFGTGAVTENAGALTFYNNSTITYANNFVFNGGSVYSYDGDVHLGTSTSTIAINGATTFNRQYGHGGTAKKLNLDGIVSGTGAITLNGISNGFGEGAGMLIGNNANTYSGTITVNSTSGSGMALIDGGNNALQFATVNVQGNGSSDTPYGFRFNPGIDAPALGSLQGNGNILLQDLAGTPAAVVLTVGGNNADVTYSGVLSGTGGLTKAGTGMMTLNTGDTYTGPTTVTGGTLTVPGSLSSSTLTVSAGTLSLTGTLVNSAVTVSSGATFTEGTTGVISGSGSLTNYSNTTLTNTNTYTGTTTVSGGTLSLSKAGTIDTTSASPTYLTTGGTLAGTSGLTVNNGGTLLLGASNSISSGPATGGTGNGGTSMTLAGGILTVASGVTQGQGSNVVGGTNDGSKLDVPGLGALTLTATSTLNFAGSSGTLVFNGLALGGKALSIDGTNFATLTGNSADGTTDRFIVESDSGAPSLAGITFANYGNASATDINLGDNFYEIVPAAVPEPSTWAVGVLSLAVLGYRGGRRFFGSSMGARRAA